MYENHRLIILDADGTTIDAFEAINLAFSAHNMAIGDVERFQDRRKLFKYIGGFKELPKNLRKQLQEKQRVALIDTLTDIYRERAKLFEGMQGMINRLIEQPDLRVGIITRNITREPEKTLQRLYRRNGVDTTGFDFLIHLPLKEHKLPAFHAIRESLMVNPARAFAIGDEKSDYVAAVGSGMHPFMVSFGFESYERAFPHAIPRRYLHHHALG